MEDPNLHRWVLRYLSGEMEEADRLAFEEACRQREDLRERLTLELQTRYAIQRVGRASLENPLVRPISPSNSFLRYRIAASFLALFLLGAAIYIFWPKRQTPSELYTAYYTVPILSQVRDSEGMDSLYLAASSAYVQQDWEKAAPLFESYLSSFNQYSDTQAYLALGICFLELDQYPKAQEYFSTINVLSSPYYFDARWYSALSYLKTEEGEKAKEQLELLQTSNVYRNKAKELLGKIDF